ncbi:hypothetical protein [Cupriavidus basilensis]
MAALGLFYVSKRYGDLPPHELPGEQQWRNDFLLWHAFRIVGRACLLPGHMREGYLARAEEVLLAGTELSEIEVDGVFECARRALHGASQDAISREEWEEFIQRETSEADELNARRDAIFGPEDD